MARYWQQASLEEARRHPLYGVKNWLAVFAFGILLLPLREFGELSAAARDAGMTVSEVLSLDGAGSAYAKGVLAFEALLVVVICWLLLTKHRSFRPVASAFLLASWPVFEALAFATRVPAVGGVVGTAFFPWVLSCAVWVTYLQRSRRVRITFENQVLVEGQQPPPVPIEVPPSQAPAPRTEHRPPLGNQTIRPMNTLPTPSPVAATSVSQSDEEEQRWAQALTEFEGASRRQGLWAKVFAEANGNEAVAKAQYLRERAGQLGEEARKRQAEQVTTLAEAKRWEADFRARIDKMRSEFVSGAGWPLEHISDLVKATEIEPSFASLADRVHGRTLLHWCAKFNLVPQAMVLLERGADADAPDGNGRRPHELADNPDLRRILLAAATARQAAEAPRRL